jgi:hypothetical protein
MMGTLTYCSTKENPQEMMMIFQPIHKRCIHANVILFENCLTQCQVSKSVCYKSILSSIKIP